MRILLIFLCGLISSLSFAVKSEISPELLQQLARDPQWINLMHYKTGIGGGVESQIDGVNFFLSSDGKTNPNSELQATLASFQDNTQILNAEEESSICRFPGRYFWLRKKFIEAGVSARLKERTCPRFQKWFETLRGVSVSLVFSSYYLNNPSSAFGHTLLRVNKAPGKGGQRFELLDYGVNFAANANTSNPLLYSYRGLFGGFPGTFTNMPYYYKVREYSNSESRDLWEYELNISPSVTDMMLLHVWEVGPTYADYWYLSENCSYFMLALLEAADPNLHLTDRLKKYVLPSDTVQIVFETPGLVKQYKFRPSIRSEFFARLRKLNQREKDFVSDIISNRRFSDELNRLPITRRRYILDAAIDNMDYFYPVLIQKPETPEAKFKSQILAERSKIDEVSEPLNLLEPTLEAPHLSHGSRRMGGGYKSSSSQGLGNMMLFDYRFAYHDILDPVAGFPDYAQIVFFDFHFGYEEKSQKLEIEDYNIFEVLSLTPYTQFSKSISWRLKVGVERLRAGECNFCHVGAISGGAGYTFKILEPDFESGRGPMIFTYMGIKMAAYQYSRSLLGLGPNVSLRLRWNPSSITGIEGWCRQDYGEFKLDHQESFDKNNGLRFSQNFMSGKAGEDKWQNQSFAVEWFHYY